MMVGDALVAVVVVNGAKHVFVSLLLAAPPSYSSVILRGDLAVVLFGRRPEQLAVFAPAKVKPACVTVTPIDFFADAALKKRAIKGYI